MERHLILRALHNASFLLRVTAILCTLNIGLAGTAAASASFPFSEDFESGSLGSHWVARSTAAGRIEVTASAGPHAGGYHLTMDSGTRGTGSLNELILTIDLSGQSNVKLSFYHKEFSDEDHVMPARFTGSHFSDGVAISADGSTWHKVQGLTQSDGVISTWERFEVDLDRAMVTAGVTYTSTFKIKFQHYDNYPIATDGFAFDDIEVLSGVIDTDADGLADDWEISHFGNLGVGPSGDYDGDGLTNLNEFREGTDPAYEDTDFDQIPDGWEIQYGLDPLDPTDAGNDPDTDGLTNLNEFLAGSDPHSASTVLAAASFPFKEDFESGDLGSFWMVQSTAAGRIQVTPSAGPYAGSYHLTMDSGTRGTSSLNELILTIDLAGQSNVKLGFYHKEFNDEDHVMPARFTGSHFSDGVAISADGSAWHKVQGLTRSDGISATWQRFEIDLDTAIATTGISFNSTFRVKFQQYDNYPVGTDGFAFDDIQLDVSQPGNSGTDLSRQEQETIKLVNEQRTLFGLAPLVHNSALHAAARRHSQDMAQNNFMSHAGSDGSSPWDRMRDAGYRLMRGGENVAAGYSTPAATVDGWMNSPGHRANILSTGFCDLGVGYAYNDSATYRHYWTLALGCQN